MKKTMRFAICGIDFSIPLVLVLCLGICFAAGVIGSLFISVEISDKLFSPLFIQNSEIGLLPTFLHSFIYFFLFPILALVFGTSYFGFMLFPLAVFVKGLFSALAVQAFFVNGNYFTAFAVYGIFLAVEAGLLLLYFAQSMRVSLAFFRARKSAAEESAFSSCLRQFAVAAACMLSLAICCGLLQYFFSF